MVITLTTSSFVQTSLNGNPAVYLATDPSWVDKADLKVDDTLMYDLKAISIIVNEISNKTGFVEKLATYLDENDDLLSNVTLGSPDVTLGKKYLMRLRYKFVQKNNGTVKYGETGNQSIFINSPPDTPIGIAGTVRAEDSGISINIGLSYTFNSPSDGFDAIRKIKYYISKVGGDTSNDLIIGDLLISDDDNTGEPIYNKWLTIALPDSNGQEHEIAYRLSNGVGESGLGETILVTPSDLPAEISALTAKNNFNDINSSIDSSTTSIIKFYWAKPTDYASLLAGDTPVTKYTIKKQEVAWNEEENVYEPVGEPTVTDLPHDAESATRPSYELSTPLTDDGATYHYVHPFNNTSSDFGKIFQFTVFASNSNGDGPESAKSNEIASYVNPSPQPFELENVRELKDTIGVPVNVHIGDLNLFFTTLSELNGMKDMIESTDVSGVVQDNGTDPFQTQTVKMKLVIQSTATTPVTIYNDYVYFEREYSEALETIDGNEVTVGTLLNKWSIKDIATELSLSPLVLGTKYKYTLYRLGKDPITSNNIELSSIPNEVLRIHFKSPEAIDFIQAYSINDDFTPVEVNGLPGIRVLFKQLETGAMNGTDAFITETNKIEYEIRSNSQTIPGMDRIKHSDVETDRQFIVQSTLGTGNSLYVRVYIKNTELDLEIEGQESSPSVQESAKTYPNAVSNVTSVVNASGTSVTVTWLKQNFSGLGGFPSANVVNSAHLINDTDPTASVLSQDLLHSDAQEATFTGLNVGHVYKLFVSSSGQYSKSSFDNPDVKKFDKSVIRKYYVATAITAVGTPGVPTNVEAYPASDQIIFNYDEPTELRGNSSDNFEYHFIVNSDDTNFAYQDEDQTLVQASVASVAGSTEAVVFKGYTDVAESNSRTNAKALVNGVVYRYASYIVSHGGDEAIENLADVLDHSNGTALTLVSVSRTPAFELRGDLAISDDLLLISTGVQKPEISATAAEGKITISINKPLNDPPTELVIVLDDNDAVGADLNPIPSFSTINVREAVADGNGGLFLLSSATNKNIGGVNYGELGYEFVVNNNNQTGGQTYSVTIRNLVNGRTHKVQARYAKTYNGHDFYSEVATVLIAAEAPPTPPENATFEVDDKTIFLNWYQPLNSGGAGVGSNSELLYQVNVSTESTQVLQLTNLSNTYLTLDANNFSAIENNTTYSVQILAFYIKGGNEIISDAVDISAITPNVAPESPDVTIVRGSNALSVSITTVDAPQSAMYPLASLDIYYKKSNDTEYTSAAVFTNNINNGSLSLAHEITNLLNGQSYDVKVVSVKAYNYAQSPAPVLISNQTPFGAPVVNGSEAQALVGNTKAIRLVVDLHGSGPITDIIALGKSANSSSIGILNLSQNDETLPSITRTGVEDGLNAGLQIATFILDFASTITQALSDAIIIVKTVHGSDASAYSAGPTGYFTDGV